MDLIKNFKNYFLGVSVVGATVSVEPVVVPEDLDLSQHFFSPLQDLPFEVLVDV